MTLKKAYPIGGHARERKTDFMKLLKTIAMVSFMAVMSPLVVGLSACSPSDTAAQPTETALHQPPAKVVLPSAYCVPLVAPNAATGAHGSIVAGAGPQVSAKAGENVVAVKGSYVWAEKGSHVDACEGSTVIADYGSTVTAYAGSRVDAYDGALVTAESGSYVVTESAHLVIAKPGSRVEVEIE